MFRLPITDARTPRFKTPAAMLALTLLLGACGSQSTTAPTATDTAAGSDTAPAEFVYDGQDHSWSSEATAG
ncbi:hypothetical protein ACFPQ6_17300, partial [Deinococcus petrolearius]